MGPPTRECSKIQQTLKAASDVNHASEVHNGDYVTLNLRDMVSWSQANPHEATAPTYDDIALTILTEVSSIYPRRGENGLLEALLSVGGSAFRAQGQNGCKGVVCEWNNSAGDDILGWEVGRCRDDSAILEWKGKDCSPPSLENGQRLILYPYDAKRAGEVFGWYFVIDSTVLGKEDEIVDIFVRWRG